MSAAPLAAGAAIDVDATVAAARQAAHQNRNAESARLFEQAVAAAPDRRSALLPELSDQLTYSGKSDAAIPLYMEELATNRLAAEARRHTLLGLALALSWDHRLGESLQTYGLVLRMNARDYDAMMGHARVLSWQNRYAPSLREYAAIRKLYPNEVEVPENIARVESWSGRQRTARRDATEILAKNPGDRNARFIRAQSEVWLGRPDLAAIDERSLAAAHRDDQNVRDLSSDIADAGRNQFRATTSTATSSDSLNIRTTTLAYEVPGNSGLTAIGLEYQPISYVGTSSVGSATERRAGVTVRDRFSDSTEIHATVLSDDITATGTTETNRVLYDTYFTLFPTDLLRFDIGSRRVTYDNVVSLRMGITSQDETISADFTPDAYTRLTLRANEGDFSDGNRRGFEQAEFERVVDRLPTLSFGLRGTSYSFRDGFNDGYFDPSRYQSTELTTRLSGNARSRLYYDVSGALGREWVQNGGARPTNAIHTSLSYVLSHPISATVFYDSFNTRQTASGFARTTIGGGLQTRW